jgi:hypothetical protein
MDFTEKHVFWNEKVRTNSLVNPFKDELKAVPETFQEILWTPVRYCVCLNHPENCCLHVVGTQKFIIITYSIVKDFF